MKEAKPVKISIEVDRTQVDEAIGRVDELAEKLKEAKAIVQALASELQNIELQVNIKR